MSCLFQVYASTLTQLIHNAKIELRLRIVLRSCFFIPLLCLLVVLAYPETIVIHLSKQKLRINFILHSRFLIP
ncbi:Uncharacterised protein [Klebsiella pneumoniae]|nr:Uncharacterised protein [Klebsiella pneumoniae]SSL44304.1 Uncharacterised protein [Klebsiella pneumoniae]SWA68081.1 Uncharacterised protein [Klebsiella pneumoniae]SXM88963.1 Uncharacterised protein [Klebsiella pneumoniae]